MLTVSIIGAGRVGGALALSLDRAGYSVQTVVYRGEKYLPLLEASVPTARFHSSTERYTADADAVFIVSGDPEIREIAESLAAGSALPKYAFHTSGSLSSAELSSLRDRGVSVASLHPLAAVSDPASGSGRFRGAYFCVEGDPEAVRVAEEIVADLEGKPFTIPTNAKPLYHAAAVMSAGHVVALLDAGIEMMKKCGLTPDDARKILVPLAAGSISNLAERTTSDAITGPYARGDASALMRHLSAFVEAGVEDELQQIYLDLALRSVEIAIKGGRDYASLRESILIAKHKSR